MSMYRVKAPLLEWEQVGDCWIAETIFGTLKVFPSWLDSEDKWDAEFHRRGSIFAGSRCDTADEAKAAAESRYRERLTAALVPVDVEALAERIAQKIIDMTVYPGKRTVLEACDDFKQAILEALNTQEQDA